MRRSAAANGDLLDQIARHPEDDAARLVYADLLQHGPEPARGELVVVQCALAGLGMRPRSAATEWINHALIRSDDVAHSDEIRRLELREAMLLKTHFKAWVKDVAEIAKVAAAPANFRFVRGFLEHVTMNIRDRGNSAVDPLPILTRLSEAAPLTTSLALTAGSVVSDATMRALLAANEMKQLRSLSLGTIFKQIPNGMQIVATSKNLAKITQLEVSLEDGMQIEMRELRRAPFWSHLEALDLSGSRVGNTFPKDLPPNLRELHLRSADVDSLSAAAIAKASSSLHHLEVLDLRGNSILGDGLMKLVKTSQLTELRALNIARNGLTTSNALSILDHPAGEIFRELRVLVLSTIRRGAWKVSALANAGGLPHLDELHLENVMFDDDAVEGFVKSELMSQLRVLNLRSNQITDKGAEFIGASAQCKNLRALHIANNQLTAGGRTKLAKSPHLASARVHA